ncbi:hypothetical protein DFJ58DRAFT_796744 [Suillus subalutaceus]|uniref:uncharacterized protein n=1 Tax=Suillus subalutaceus TaxID=48586 RepID=UPI001B86D085|nr:uncharacterized protein DFJ58DRAFT_796744 [Suillus subalutaceus]KAG1848067.1 hypothetical protein DFJ58DRAFT_796744 [Suillus subalutaceus]
MFLLMYFMFTSAHSRQCWCLITGRHRDLQWYRTLYSIISSCILTLFACTWTSIHLNISCHSPRAGIILAALVAPKLVILWAMRQIFHAGKFVNKFNDELFKGESIREPGLPLSVTGSFRWSRTHGFFAMMGGFILYYNGQPHHTLARRTFRLHTFWESRSKPSCRDNWG